MEKQKNIPQLRFPEFEGEWDENHFGRLFSFKTTNSFSREQLTYDTGDVKNIHYGDVHTKFQTLFEIKKEPVPYINSNIPLHKISEDNYCKEGDVIFADASEDLNDVGKSIEVVNLDNQKVLSGLHTILARPKRNAFQVGFAGYLMKSSHVRTQIQKESQGTKVLSISSNRLSKISILFPSLPEQQKVASFFTAIDQKISQLKKKKILLEQYKKGVMQKIFSQLIRFRDDNGQEFPKWEKKRLGEIGSVQMCKRIFAHQTEKSGEVPFYKIGTLGNVPDAFISRELFNEYKSKYNYPHEGYTLITCSGTVGKCVQFDGHDSYYQDSNIVWIDNTDKDVLNDFLFLLLSSYKWEELNSTTITRIYTSDLKVLQFSFPNLKEQLRIANFLSAIDDKINHTQKQIERADLWKKGLMQQMFC